MTQRTNAFKKILPYAVMAVASFLLVLATLYFKMPQMLDRLKLYAAFFIADIYLWLRFKSITQSNTSIKKSFVIIYSILRWIPYVILVGCMMVMLFSNISRYNTPDLYNIWGISTMLYLFKLGLAFLLLLFDVIKYVKKRKSPEADFPFLTKTENHIPHIFAILSTIFIGIMLYGILYESKNFKVRHIEIETGNTLFATKPMKVVLFSDIHLGTWHNAETVQTIVNLINEQDADLLLYAGDLVQSTSREIPPYLSILSQLHAPMGIYSIIGNHDYATYSDLRDKAQREEDMARLTDYERQLGWTLLRNESTKIAWNGDSITIAGCEFWCSKDIPICTGDLAATFKNVNDSDYTIFLSHSPEIWKRLVNDALPADLTVCGHTHGMQAGFNNEHFRLSPSFFYFPQWGGLYTNKNNPQQKMYVNVGLASTGMPARIGMSPEITVIIIN